eukprot:753482-Hanusia_phi.AAC.2
MEGILPPPAPLDQHVRLDQRQHAGCNVHEICPFHPGAREVHHVAELLAIFHPLVLLTPRDPAAGEGQGASASACALLLPFSAGESVRFIDLLLNLLAVQDHAWEEPSGCWLRSHDLARNYIGTLRCSPALPRRRERVGSDERAVPQRIPEGLLVVECHDLQLAPLLVSKLQHAPDALIEREEYHG